nr:hypothetical protein BaRGS_022740 [Batillaria attramentaria]
MYPRLTGVLSECAPAARLPSRQAGQDALGSFSGKYLCARWGNGAHCATVTGLNCLDALKHKVAHYVILDQL